MVKIHYGNSGVLYFRLELTKNNGEKDLEIPLKYSSLPKIIRS
jgi:hypothetical protein